MHIQKKANIVNLMYKVDVNANIVIDTTEGIGCRNKDAVVVTDYGMYFADANHVYHHDGTKINTISFPIDTDTGDSSARSYTQDFTDDIKLYFSTRYNSLFVMNTSITATFIYCYHVLKQRWDFRRIDLKNTDNSFSLQTIANNVMIPSKVDGKLYTFTDVQGKGSESTDHACKLVEVNKGSEFGRFIWQSKSFSMGADTVDKKFLQIKIEASSALPTAPTVEVDGSSSTLSALGSNEYKLTTNKKGKNIRVTFPLGNDGIEVFAVGIVYRMLKIS